MRNKVSLFISIVILIFSSCKNNEAKRLHDIAAKPYKDLFGKELSMDQIQVIEKKDFQGLFDKFPEISKGLPCDINPYVQSSRPVGLRISDQPGQDIIFVEIPQDFRGKDCQINSGFLVLHKCEEGWGYECKGATSSGPSNCFCVCRTVCGGTNTPCGSCD